MVWEGTQGALRALGPRSELILLPSPFLVFEEFMAQLATVPATYIVSKGHLPWETQGP